MLKKIWLPVVIVLFLIAFFLRFYNLGAIPLGLNKDETAIGYNAYSILETGKDEHGVQTPLYFKSYNDYKLPVYIYLTAASEKVFGLNPMAVRLPSAVFGVIAIISLFFLVKIISKRLDLAIVSALLLAFNPWQFFFSRTGFEVNVATALIILGSLLFVLAVRYKGNIILLTLAIILFGFSMYSYNVTRIFAPILLLTLTALHYKEVKKWPRINKIVGGLFAVAMFLPLAITLKNGSGFSNQVAGVFLNGVSTKSRLLEFRSYLIGIPEIYSKLFFNSQIMTIWEFLKNLLHSFSTEFFFFVGPKPLNGIANHGVFYPFELITIVVGLYTGWKRKEKYLRFFFLWLAIGILLIAMTQEVPHPTRSFMQVIPFVIFSAYGLLAIWNALKTIRHAIQRSMLQFGMIAVISYAVLIYFTTYFFVFPANEAKVWRASEADLITHLAKIEKNYDRIVIDSKTDFSYMALAFYTKLPPAEYQKKVVYKQAGLLTTAAKLKKYEFAEIDWDAYNSTRNTLYVTTIDGYQGKPVLQILTFPERQIVMPIGRTIGTFPFKDPAYVLIESPREPK